MQLWRAVRVTGVLQHSRTPIAVFGGFGALLKDASVVMKIGIGASPATIYFPYLVQAGLEPGTHRFWAQALTDWATTEGAAHS